MLGDDNFLTTTTYKNLADNLDAQGRHALAQPLYERVLANVRRARGADHPDLAIIASSLAWNLRIQGKHDLALPLYEKALAIRRQALGEEHPQTARSANSLATCLFVLGKEQRAEEMAERASRAFQAARLHVSFAGLERSSFAEKFSAQEFLALLRARAGKAEAAWQALDQYLARGLLDEVAARQRLLPPAVRRQFDELRRRSNLVERQLLALVGKNDAESRRQLQRLHEQQQQAGRELREMQARLAKELGPAAGAVYDRKRVQKSLPEDAAVVAWLDWGKICWACLLRQRGLPVWIKLAAPEDRAGADLALKLSRADDQAGWLALAQRLYKQRLEPLSKHLQARDGMPAVKHLVVLPSPALAEVPIETLLLAGKSELTVSYAPSATLFASLQEKRSRSSASGPARLLALGDPLFAQPASGEDEDRAARLPRGGIFLSAVVPGGSAARAGLRGGDVLLSYGASKLAKMEDLRAALKKHATDKEVEVEFWRGGRVLSRKVESGLLRVQLSSQPASEAVKEARQADALVARSLHQRFTPLPGTRGEVLAIAKLFAKADNLLLGAQSERADAGRGGRQGQAEGLSLPAPGDARTGQRERKPLESFLALEATRICPIRWGACWRARRPTRAD